MRQEIDDIDARLLERLNQQACCAQRVGEIRSRRGAARVTGGLSERAGVLSGSGVLKRMDDRRHVGF
ncbi:MAG: chorismate mutase [Zoogloeaceae bacterium]|jgi:chorismate mutase|nr:chorismate mutase [Zoogloeaceae bacterium]